MKKSFSAGGVVLNAQNEVLVVSQHGDSWSLPKGHIDEGENALSAAKREIYEESGISEHTLEYIKELDTYERFRIGDGGRGEDRTDLKVITMFLFRTKASALSPVDPENPEARWVPVKEAAELLTHPKDKEFFLGIARGLEKE